MYKKNLLLVVKYLRGKIDLYNGSYGNAINTWDEAWDEMRFSGYNPQDADDVEKYIKEEL